MKKKISIIGLGKIGKKHFSELRRSDYFELVGICDKNEKLDNFARFEFFNDIENMFVTSKPQAVIIATPSKTHKEIILKSMKYVKNIFVESPCTENLEQVREMRYAANTSQTKIAVGFNGRFNPTVISLLREFKKENEEIYSISIIRSCDCGEDIDIIDDLLLKDLDLVRFILKTEISNINIKRSSFENKEVISSNLKTKNGILVNIISGSLYPIDRVLMEISTKSGVYLADLVNFTLHKITMNGRVNLRVENEDFSIRNEHKCFLDVCENKEFGNLANMEDVIKIREILR
ncbi:Gfo/Idh/MocA family protein [Campylobacter ureolyticus]|uniref:Gfo/Idh/MocA family protein n=1 Tax=Campylobacter ureolyticus TaxID=827 RepID=UPI0022B5A86D|nr:Gfo/Idh/MocA family oxidoreductase [Campylobacter ureolyticus]MCZ6169403.1 Gfo/Idh/MocA family oxidoreductase [Campylobacter ureolyticus]